MSEKKDKTPKDEGDSFNVTIGSHSSDIVIGKNIQQIKGSPQAKAEVTEADLDELRQLFAALKETVVAEAPPEKKSAALERVEELEEAVSPEKPDLTTMEYVKKWFLRNLPQVAGSVTSLLVHPIVGKVVEAAGELAADELKRRFGTTAD